MKKNLVSVFLMSLFLITSVSVAAPPLIDLGAEAKKTEKMKQDRMVQEQAKMQAEADKKAKDQGRFPSEEEMKPPAEWGYFDEKAPRFWGALDPRYLTCKIGKNQSPVDLREKRSIGTTGLPALDVYYRESDLKIINTGKAVQVNYPLGSFIQLDGQRFEFINMTFHTPSEHQIEGFNYPMELQLIHRDGDGNHVIIAMVFQEGESNGVLQTIVDHLPSGDKEKVHKGVKIHPAKFFPKDTKFYKYSGSLTTPPCSEGVYWMVFKQTLEASFDQIQAFNELMGDNARPTQSKNSRSVLKSWSEGGSQAEENRMYEFY